VLNSDVAKNIFIALPEAQKYEFVRSIHQQYGVTEDLLAIARKALSQQYYAPYLLVLLIDRDTFKKISNFEPYEQCVRIVSNSELVELSNNQRNEEMVMNFLRYVDMLGASDERKVKGQLLKDRVFELEKYKAYKNNSLHVLDHESIIQEEGGFDEGVKKNLVYQKVPAQEKAHLRDFDISVIHQSFRNGDQYAIIDYLRSYKISDLLFIRGHPDSSHSIFTYSGGEPEFTEQVIPDTQFNILQLAILGDHFDLVKYILVEHKTFSNTKQPRTIDPTIILFN
jgi:hypothetical protein